MFTGVSFGFLFFQFLSEFMEYNGAKMSLTLKLKSYHVYGEYSFLSVLSFVLELLKYKKLGFLIFGIVPVIILNWWKITTPSLRRITSDWVETMKR